MAILTDRGIQEIERALSAGASDEEAARAAGIAPARLRDAIIADPDLAARFEQARASARVEALALIRRAALGHPSRIETTEYGPDGKIVSRRIVEQTERDWNAARWLRDNAPPLSGVTIERGATGLLTPKRREALNAAWAVSPFHQPAAQAAGIGYDTLKGWLRRGRQYRAWLTEGDLADADQGTRALYMAGERAWGSDRQAALAAIGMIFDRLDRPAEQKYLDLLGDFEEQTARLELDLAHLAVEDARRNPHRALKVLQVLFRDRYGDRAQVEVSGPGGGPLEIADAEAARAEAQELLDGLRAEQEKIAGDA